MRLRKNVQSSGDRKSEPKHRKKEQRTGLNVDNKQLLEVHSGAFVQYTRVLVSRTENVSLVGPLSGVTMLLLIALTAVICLHTGTAAHIHSNASTKTKTTTVTLPGELRQLGKQRVSLQITRCEVRAPIGQSSWQKLLCVTEGSNAIRVEDSFEMFR